MRPVARDDRPGNGSCSFFHHARRQSLAPTPPFLALSGAVCLDVGAVDGKLRRDGACAGHLLEKLLPDAPSRPPVIAVVDRGGRTVFRRHIAPAAAGFQDVQNAGDYTAIIHPWLPGLPMREMRFNGVPCRVREPEQAPFHLHTPFRKPIRRVNMKTNSDNCMGSQPRLGNVIRWRIWSSMGRRSRPPSI